jgi:uncharacterized phage-associated protein
VNIFDVAKYFISKADPDSGEVMTHLKLQKLTYYAQAWHLAIEGKPLFEGRFEAWAHGPVNTRLFNAYRGYGWHPIPYPEDFDPSEINQSDREYLDEIWNLYGRYDAKYLERLTHSEEPWIEARGGLPEGAYCDRQIDENTIARYYGGLIEDEQG